MGCSETGFLKPTCLRLLIFSCKQAAAGKHWLCLLALVYSRSHQKTVKPNRFGQHSTGTEKYNESQNLLQYTGLPWQAHRGSSAIRLKWKRYREGTKFKIHQRSLKQKCVVSSQYYLPHLSPFKGCCVSLPGYANIKNLDRMISF